MLVNSLSNVSATGSPVFTYSLKIVGIFEQVLLDAVPVFIQGLGYEPRTKKLDENGFSQEFVTELNRSLMNNPKGILAVPEYQDFYILGANPAKRVDIAFVSSEQRSSKTKLYTVEAKRLPTGSGREKEYVCGFFTSGSPSGGIQRFKTGDHGYALSKSALLGYVESQDFTYWHNSINGWILEKVQECPKEWKEVEQLKELEINQTHTCSVSRSVAYRQSDSIELFHLWISIPSKSEDL